MYQLLLSLPPYRTYMYRLCAEFNRSLSPLLMAPASDTFAFSSATYLLQTQSLTEDKALFS